MSDEKVSLESREHLTKVMSDRGFNITQRSADWTQVTFYSQSLEIYAQARMWTGWHIKLYFMFHIFVEITTPEFSLHNPYYEQWLGQLVRIGYLLEKNEDYIAPKETTIVRADEKTTIEVEPVDFS